MRKFLIIGATLSALLGGLLPPILMAPSTMDRLTHTTVAALAATGLRPLDIMRLLPMLMALHYALAAPAILKRGRQVWRTATIRQRLFGTAGVAARFTLSVAVPVAFYAVIDSGGHQAVTMTGIVPLA